MKTIWPVLFIPPVGLIVVGLALFGHTSCLRRPTHDLGSMGWNCGKTPPECWENGYDVPCNEMIPSEDCGTVDYENLSNRAKLRMRFLTRCERCGRSSVWGHEHDTWYEDGRGINALCESCWQELGTPEARLPFYWKVVNAKIGGWDNRNEVWPKIVEAVKAEAKTNRNYPSMGGELSSAP